MPAANGESIAVGIRVVRGPDWSKDFEDQDGGEGHLGSLVDICGQSEDDMYPKDCVVVQWDNGERNVYRAGYEKAYDIRTFDNAGIGINHKKSCSNCEVNVVGLLWTCNVCSGTNLCSDCYGEDKHDISHAFIRYDYPGDEGVIVPKRRISKKIATKGIFEKSKVQRGPDWRWQNQDGGDGKEGEVIAIVNFSPETDHDAVEVTWQNGYTNVYRLGYRGRLDVKCVRPAKGGYYYRDHLPILKMNSDASQKPGRTEVEEEERKEKERKVDDKVVETKPASPQPAPPPEVKQDTSQETISDKSESSAAAPERFKSGDRVKIEIDVDVLKMIEENRGAWNEEMTECIGKVGHVCVCKDIDVTVDFESAGRFTFHESVLNKVKEFQKGETVKVKGTLSHVRMLQTERGGWNDMMSKVLSKKGRVQDIDEDGDVMVSFGHYTWTFNPECLLESEGPPDILRESDDEQEESKPSVNPVEDDKLEELFGTIFAGNNERFSRIVQREPQLMLMEHKGELAIHQAALCGNIEIVKTLLQTAGKDNQLENVDNEGNTPVLSATKGGSIEMVAFLVEAGCNKDAANKNSETAVHIAVENKNVSMLKKLRDLGFDINRKNALQQSPLFDAIVKEDPEILTTILGWPSLDVTIADSIGFTPLTSACRSGNTRAVVDILGKAPTELNKQKDDGYAGLHVAVYNKRLEVVTILLNQSGMKIDLETKDGKTPLHIASEVGSLEIVRLLINKGANITMVDKSYKTCLHLCAESSAVPEVEKSAVLAIAKLLLENGVGVHSKDSSGKMAVDYLVPAYKDEFQDLVKKHDVSKQYDSSDPHSSLPANIGSDGKPSGPEGPPSLDSKSRDKQQPPVASQGPVLDDADPELCEACDEEEPRFRLEPCRHLLCKDCIPPKKAKKKFCNFCRETVNDVIEFDQR